MSFAPDKDPRAGDAAACDAIELTIVPRSVDLGSFSVRRALPHSKRRMVSSLPHYSVFMLTTFSSVLAPFGCVMNNTPFGAFMYADDLILLAPSLCELNRMINIACD
jgi:hypothetical protein